MYIKKQGNMILPNNDNNLPVTKLKDMEIANLPNKEFKIQ